jgi:glycosyltransferase involved in cell wall biosynthesis
LLDDPARRARMGIRARQWAVAHFDWQALSRQALQIFIP